MLDRDPLSTVVRVSLPGSEFGETMIVLRTWLDRQNIQPTAFKTAPDGVDGYTFTIGFRSPEDAGRFRSEFGNPTGPALAA